MKNLRASFPLISATYTYLAMAAIVPPIASCNHSNSAPSQSLEDAAVIGQGDALDAPLPTGAGEVSQTQTPSDASLTDVVELTCGEVICGPSQICLYPAYGRIGFVVPDSGTCPDGTDFSSTNSRICIQTSLPSPSCVTPPTTGSFDCSGPDTAATCRTVNAPIPSYCRRTCRLLCS